MVENCSKNVTLYIDVHWHLHWRWRIACQIALAFAFRMGQYVLTCIGMCIEFARYESGRHFHCMGSRTCWVALQLRMSIHINLHWLRHCTWSNAYWVLKRHVWIALQVRQRVAFHWISLAYLLRMKRFVSIGLTFSMANEAICMNRPIFQKHVWWSSLRENNIRRREIAFLTTCYLLCI